MPAVMTLGGIALAVLGLLIAIAGMPDRAAGLGLGSDLIQSGAAVFVGGLIIAALGQVLKALRDVADRVEEAGFGITAPRSALNDALSEAPMPLPRAARSAPAPAQARETAEDPPMQPGREPRSPRGPQPAPRTERPVPEAPLAQRQPQQRPGRRAGPEFDAPQEPEFADDYQNETPGGRPAPRWMRAQTEAASPQAAGAMPHQANRQSRAMPAQAHSPAEEPAPRRRTLSAPEPENFEQNEPTVVRSGIIAGMAYTLYSDRSIEAELPAGTVRFGSIEELQEHVKRAGVDEQEEYRGPNAAPH